MLFNSYIFIFCFLPLCLFLWFGLNHKKKYIAAQVVLVAMSLWFYGYYNPFYIFIILGSMVGNYLASMGIAWSRRHCANRKNLPKVIGSIGILFDLGLLFYFKYYNFFLENINRLFQQDIALREIALPLGISFFTFQQIGFIADRIMGEAPHYTVLDYMTYVTYFPQLIAGPIVSHSDLIPQFQDKSLRSPKLSNILTGIRLFSIGLGKKILLADEFGKIVDAGFATVDTLDTPGALLVGLLYAMQIFLDFSGYCDMAMGIGEMMNIQLPLNFDSPYKSCSVKEFWKRWHMTLCAFLTRYVYIPLGGGRCGKVKKMRNTMIVFLISGIWHGANWTFVLWGVTHGIMIFLENFGFMKRVPRKIGWIYTFLFIVFSDILFRSDSIGVALQFYKRIFSMTNTGIVWNLLESLYGFKLHPFLMIAEQYGGFYGQRMVYVVTAIFLIGITVWLCSQPNARQWVTEKTATRKEMWIWAFVVSLSVLSFSGISIFLYFNF